jgi:hypothetical protein
MGPQFVDHAGGQRHGSPLAALWRLEAQACFCLFQTFDYGKASAVEIDPTPSKGADLAAAQAAQESKQGRDRQWRSPNCVYEFNALGQVVGLNRLPFNPGRIDGVSGIMR